MSFWVQLPIKPVYTNIHGDAVHILNTFFLTVYSRVKLDDTNSFWFLFSYQTKMNHFLVIESYMIFRKEKCIFMIEITHSFPCLFVMVIINW